jgi:hypothetical protein
MSVGTVVAVRWVLRGLARFPFQDGSGLRLGWIPIITVCVHFHWTTKERGYVQNE